jgi:hypothetical protein
VKAVEEIPTKVDANDNPMLDAPAHVTSAGEVIDHPDVVVTEDEPSGFEDTSDPVVERLIVPAARSESVVSDTPTPETKQEEIKDGSTTTHAIKHAEETAPATSEEPELSVGEEISIESLTKGDITSVTPELTPEHVTEATDGKASHRLDESTISHGPHLVDEVSILAAKEIQQSLPHDAELTSLAPAMVTIEATDPMSINQTELVAPNTTIDIPTPASDDTAVHERVVEPQEVHDMERVEAPTALAVHTTDKETVVDPTLFVEQAKHGLNPSAEVTTIDEGHIVIEPHKEGLIDLPMTEMRSVDDGPTVVEPAELEPVVLPKETTRNTAEEGASSGSGVLEGSSSDLASTGEVSVSVPEMADADVHSRLEEGVSVDDVDPVAREMLHSDESSEEPVPPIQVAHDTMAAANSKSIESADPVFNEVSVVPSANPHAQESSECTLVESLPTEGAKVEEVKHAEEGVADVDEIQEESITEKAATDHEASRTDALPEVVDDPHASNQDDHPEERSSAVVDAGLPSEEVKSSERNTTPEVVEEKKAVETIAEERAPNEQTAAMGPAAEGEHSPEEGPAPAGEPIVEQEVSDVTDAAAPIPESGTVEDTITAAEPIHVSQEAETVPTQKDTEDAALEVDSSPSAEKDTHVQSSSEQPELDHVQEHTGPEAVVEFPVHEITESPEVRGAATAETPVVDADSDVSAEGPIKEELIGNQIVEMSPASVNSEDDITDLSLKQGVVEEIVMASGPIHVPQEALSVDTVSAQQDTEDAAPEINTSLSVGRGITPAQPSSELPTLDDVQSHVHTEAETVDELQKGPEAHQAVDAETPVVEVDSDVPAGGLMKEELIHPEGKQIVEMSPASVNSEDDTTDLSLEQGAVGEIVMASGPIHVPQEILSVDTVPAQQDTKDAAPEITTTLSVGKTTPAQPSSELPTLDDVQSHVHTEAETVDELQKDFEVHQAVDAERSLVDDRLMKEELITDGEQLVEPLVDELAPVTSVKQEIQQAGPSTDDASAPEMSNETKAAEGIASTPEDAATEAKSIAEEVVPFIQGAPVVPEDESQPVTTGDVPFTLAESSIVDQPNLQPIADSQGQEVFAPLVEATKEFEATQEAAVPVTHVEIVEGGKIPKMKSALVLLI